MNNFNKSKMKNVPYKRPYVDHQRSIKRKANKATKTYRQKLVRGQLYPLIGQEVHVSADLTSHYVHTTMESGKAVLFTNCVVNNTLYEQHFWIHVPMDIRQKLLLAPNNSRVYFTGVPHTYTSRHDHESDKIGIKNIRLIKEIT